MRLAPAIEAAATVAGLEPSPLRRDIRRNLHKLVHDVIDVPVALIDRIVRERLAVAWSQGPVAHEIE